MCPIFECSSAYLTERQLVEKVGLVDREKSILRRWTDTQVTPQYIGPASTSLYSLWYIFSPETLETTR